MPWYYYLILILSGAFGAVITILVKKYQGRVQPVSTSVRLIRVFGSMGGKSSLKADLVVEKDGKEYKCDNLYIASVTLTNTGNKDYKSFEFGITLPENAYIIHTDDFSVDRHHIIERKTDIDLGKTVKEIDYRLKPLNRNERYQFDLHIVLSSTSFSSSEIIFSSAHPVKFVDQDEAIKKTAKILASLMRWSPLFRP